MKHEHISRKVDAAGTVDARGEIRDAVVNFAVNQVDMIAKDVAKRRRWFAIDLWNSTKADYTQPSYRYHLQSTNLALALAFRLHTRLDTK